MIGFRPAGLRSRMLLIGLLVVVVALGLRVLSIIEERGLQVAEYREEALRLTRHAALDQEKIVDGARQLLFVLATDPLVSEENPAACSAFLTQVRKTQPIYANFMVFRPNGDTYCGTVPLDQPVNGADRVWFQRAVESRAFAVGDFQIGRVTGKPLLVVAYPVLHGSDEVRGVVNASIALETLGQLMTEAPLPVGAVLVLLDRHGTVLARFPESGPWIGRAYPDAPAVEAILSRGGGVAELVGVDDVRRLQAFARVGGTTDTGLYVSIGIPLEVALVHANQNFWRSLAILGFTTLLVMSIVWQAGSALVVRPAQRLLRATRRMEAGDLGVRTGPPYLSGELGQLSRAFDSMAAALQARRVEAEQARQALEESGALLEKTFASMSEAIFVSSWATGAIVDCNPAAERITGYRKEELIGQTGELLHVDREAFKGFVRQSASALVASRAFHAETVLRRKDGTLFPTEHSMAVTTDATGRPLLLVSIVRDITERKRAEDELRQQADRLRLLHELDLDVLAPRSIRDVALVALRQIRQLVPEEHASIILFGPTGRGAAVYTDDGDGSPEDAPPVRVTATCPALAGDGDRMEPSPLPSSMSPIQGMQTDEGCSFVNAPLVSGGELMGYLSLAADAASAFGPQHLTIITEVSTALAGVIQQSRLRQNLVAERDRLQSLSRRLVEVQETERRNIAAELHDEVGGLLTGLKITLDTSAGLPAAEAAPKLAEARALVGQLLARIRDLSLVLRPALLDDLGLLPALLWHCERFSSQTGVQVSFGHSGVAERRFTPKVETAVYRIVQEALTNVARHAGVAAASVDVRASRRSLTVKVEDQGAGFDLQAALAAGGASGLAGMYERAAALNGRLTIETRPSAGTCLTATVPLGKQATMRRGGGKRRSKP